MAENINRRYQLGSDEDWLKISNDELGKLVKKRNRQLSLWRTLAFLLMILLGWVVYKYSQVQAIPTLWQLPS